MWKNAGTAAAFVACAVNDAADAVQDEGGEAHDAGFQGGVEGHVARARPEFWRDVAQGLAFGVPPWVGGRMVDGVFSGGDDLCVEGDDATDGEIAFLEGVSGHEFGRIHAGQIP